MPDARILIYLLRRDLRVSDNPILHSLSTQKDHGFTHLLPLYVFPAQQIEVKGFIPEKTHAPSPYPEARSRIGGFWRCGPHRAKFLVESVWDVKQALEDVESGLCIRVGMVGEVVREMLRGINERNDATVGAVWMVGDEGVEEKREERDAQDACREATVEFKLWQDEKYLVDDRDVTLKDIQELPDIFTVYRKTVEPLREQPRSVLPAPSRSSLPPFPSHQHVPAQHWPFAIPDTFDAVQTAILQPLTSSSLVHNAPAKPQGTTSAHPFKGGESCARIRLDHIITSGVMNSYKETRNGLLGPDFSTKLSAWLALGSITARQIHASLLVFENGTSDDEDWKKAPGYGRGESEGTKSVRFELLWRDYMRLCARKFAVKLFRLSGFRDDTNERWAKIKDPETQRMIDRFIEGTTGMGFIDASQREVYHTGYTSNRARQNVASFLAKHLSIDWRIGAEWYECILVDYDLSSNWGNWQYVAGVGNDPRGARVFNPVKQAFDYDPNGDYVKAWVPELRADGLAATEIFQSWTISPDKREQLGLAGLLGVEKPLKTIQFTVGNRGRGRGRGGRGGGGGGGGGGSGGSGHRGGGGSGSGSGGSSAGNNPNPGERGMGRSGGQSRGGHAGRGYGGSSRGHLNSSSQHRGYSRWGGSGHGAGKEARMGMMDKERAGQQDGTMA